MIDTSQPLQQQHHALGETSLNEGSSHNIHVDWSLRSIFKNICVDSIHLIYYTYCYNLAFISYCHGHNICVCLCAIFEMDIKA